MEVRYASQKVQDICTNERQMKRRLDAVVSKKLRLRGTGRWERLTADRAGQWSARLSANWRLIVVNEGGSPVVALVIEITDYH